MHKTDSGEKALLENYSKIVHLIDSGIGDLLYATYEAFKACDEPLKRNLEDIIQELEEIKDYVKFKIGGILRKESEKPKSPPSFYSV